ncbi:hypothetical protein Tco_1565466, partial [Tanacetum coccineum]
SINTLYLVMQEIAKPVDVEREHLYAASANEIDKKPKLKDLPHHLEYAYLHDSLWVSPIHVVPKKGGMNVVLNDNNELIPSRMVTGWRILPNSNHTQGSRKDNIHLSLWDFCLPNDAFWVIQHTSHLPKMHDGNFPRHGGRLYGSIHG